METQRESGLFKMPQAVRKLFEDEFAKRLGVPHAVAVNSGTSALVAALMSIDVAGREVITTPYSFASTWNAIVLAGGTPVFCDVGTNALLDPNKIPESITEKTKAILPVHLFGRVCDMDSINYIAARHKLSVIEDTAQSLGATQHDQYAGTFGYIGCFSFGTMKNMSCGEGGMIIGGDEQRIRLFTDPVFNRSQGFPVVGHNFRMSPACSLIGYEKVKLHWDQVLSELGRFSEDDGFYSEVAYESESMKKFGVYGQCPIAEALANKCKNLY